MTHSKHDSVWPVLIDQGEIGLQPYRREITAGDVDRKEIAAFLEIPDVESLNATLILQRLPGNKAVIHVEGLLKAAITQSCVITDAPVKARLEDEFEAWFADPSSFVSFTKAKNEKASKTPEGEVQIVDEREDPEPIINGKIDIGDLVVQYLSLALPQYPRAHGVRWDNSDDPEIAPPEGTQRPNPFAALKGLKVREE